ncbi:MAG: RNA-guided endonuclease InsQ/TnpB family protein, partial [Thermodesulfobacteriota bacterium]
MLLKKGFRYCLDPTNSQKMLFAQFAGASRFLYNRGLEQRKTMYEKEGKSISYFEQNNETQALRPGISCGRGRASNPAPPNFENTPPLRAGSPPEEDELVSLKKEEKTVWMRDIHSQVLQQALKNLDFAFQNFFQNVQKGKKPGFPRFKCKGIRDSFR